MGGKSKSSTKQTSENHESIFNNTGDGDSVSLSESSVGGNVAITNTDYDAIDAAGELARDALDVVYDHDAEFLGEVGSFADQSMQTAERMAELSFQQSGQFMNQVARESEANRDFMLDANDRVTDAYQMANTGLRDLTENTLHIITDNQQDAMDAVNEGNAQAQKSAEKAIDYVFESSKSATERTTETTTKWVVGGVVAAMAIPVLAKAVSK